MAHVHKYRKTGVVDKQGYRHNGQRLYTCRCGKFLTRGKYLEWVEGRRQDREQQARREQADQR